VDDEVDRELPAGRVPITDGVGARPDLAFGVGQPELDVVVGEGAGVEAVEARAAEDDADHVRGHALGRGDGHAAGDTGRHAIEDRSVRNA